ncbi:MAG: FitA-like ribbon-helix-helix domain-containing protein, partial [Aestuariivirga sp.]
NVKNKKLDIIAITAYNDCMASITIRNLDDETKRRLRIRAAENGRSMEEEAREVLRRGTASVGEGKRETLWSIVREIVEPYGGFELEIPPRTPPREPPTFDE